MLSVIAIMKAFKQVFHLFGRDTIAIVAHLDFYLVVFIVGDGADRHGATFFAIFGCVR